MSSHSRRTQRPATMAQLSSESDDHHGLPEGSPPLRYRHATIGMPPFENTFHSGLASMHSGTTENIQEALFHQRNFIFPLLDQKAPIGVLPDDVLLKIFGFYRVSLPLHWHRLAHVCQRWRRIVFASPLGLDLRLYCKRGTPVLKTLDCWPALPIVVRDKGCPMLGPPTPEDDDNIVAALKHSDRIRSVSLTITYSLLGKLDAIAGPFPELEDLELLCRYGLPLPFPVIFQWGTRLRSLRLTGIFFSALPQLLSSCPDLVDLQLLEIFSFENLSPQTFTSALSGMTKLQSLSLSLHSLLRFHPSLTEIPPLSGERFVLPALTRLKYRGTSDYLNNFITRIDAPHLADIEIMFVNQPTIDISPLSQFIDRIEMQKSHRRADIISSDCAISMSLTRPRAPVRLELGISCRQLHWQLSSLNQICKQLSRSLLNVRDLRIETMRTSSRRDYYMNGGRWSELIRSFGGAERFHVAGELAVDILNVLRPAVGEHTGSALPALANLYVMGPRSRALQDAVRSIIDPRRLSGSPIVGKYINAESRNDKTLPEPTAEDESTSTRTCRYCNGRFAERQGLFQRQTSDRAHPEECEERCRFCRSPRSQCLSASQRRRHRHRLPGPPNGVSPDNVNWIGHHIPEHPTEPPPTTPLHISETRLTRRPTNPLRNYRRFIPNLRCLGTILKSRLRGRAEAADQPLDDWFVVGNDTAL